MFVKDHLHFLREDAPFYPIIFSGNSLQTPTEYNTAIIHLPADMQTDLNWNPQIEEAKKLVEQGKNILWHLDFGLESLSYSYDHKLQFGSFKLATDTFTKNIYPDFKENTLGVLLCRGEFEEVLSSFGPVQSNEEILKAADIFVDFLRLFFPALPDDILTFLELETSFGQDHAFTYQLLSKERFEYFSLITREKNLFTSALSLEPSSLSLGYMGKEYKKMAKNMPTVGLLFPPDDLFPLVHSDINKVLSKISMIPTRLIYESFLIDEIDGIDRLIVFEKGVSPLGKRQVQGFIAAVGEVITIGKSLGFASERSFEEFLRNRGRGI
jgi:hypothetical protein